MPVPVKNIGGKQADNKKLPPMMGQSFGREAEPPEPVEEAPAFEEAPTEDPMAEGTAQIDPMAAGYVPDGPKCAGCMHFDVNACKLVSGPIEPKGWCKLHSPGGGEEVEQDAPMAM